MKILHLTGEIEDTGGVLSVIRNLQEASHSLGCSHYLWVNQCFDQKRLPAIDLRFSRNIRPELPGHVKLLWHAIPAWLELNQLLRTESFDVIHGHTRGAFLVTLLLAAVQRKPVVFTNHNYANRTGMYRRASRFKHFFTVLLTPNMARHYGMIVAPPKISLISDCSSDRFFSESLVRSCSKTLSGDSLKLVGVGSLVRWKGWHWLIQAVSRLPEDLRRRIDLVIWGPTLNSAESRAYESELKGMIQEWNLGGQIRLGGNNPNVKSVLREAQWFVLPSTNEPCSVALTEALALGLPALVSRSGGNVDIIESGRNGLFFTNGDSDDLAARLQDILTGKASCSSPEDIRESVRPYSAMAVARKYMDLYEQIGRLQTQPLHGRVNARPRTPSQSR
jgi:glycosyltransferase involved in cell wall biosynthesis